MSRGNIGLTDISHNALDCPDALDTGMVEEHRVMRFFPKNIDLGLTSYEARHNRRAQLGIFRASVGRFCYRMKTSQSLTPFISRTAMA